VALSALSDMTEWLLREGDVAIYDATNSTRSRRALVRERCQKAGLQVMFVELLCDDPEVIEGNIRSTKLSSPDYENVDTDAAIADFRARIAHYERVYEPLDDDEGAFARVEEAGRSMQVHHIDGYLASRLVFFLMNLHLSERPVLLTRHGESEYNQRALLGGDPSLSNAGKRYADALGAHLGRTFPDPGDVVVWTSSLARAVQTAVPLRRRALSWRALDEIDAGICEGMTYEEIRAQMPQEFAARKADKLHYRYPRGESYEDVIRRLDLVVIELERTRRPVLVIAHNAVIRALYAYFVGVPRERCPHLDIPLHTLIELRTHAYGCAETRTPLS
jgi:broad specificity phosphatase PhoE